MVHPSLRLYKDLYEACDKAPLYAAPWWLDATCGEGRWDTVSINNEKNKTTIIIPFFKTHIRGLSAIITPPMTQWLPVLNTSQKEDYSIAAFLQSLPTCSILDLAMKPGAHPVLPDPSFHVNYKYSYIIPPPDVNVPFRSKYNEGLRRNLRDAEKKYQIEVTDDVPTFLKLCHSSYAYRKMSPPRWLDDILPRVVAVLAKNNSGLIHIAKYEGKAIAGILTGWDKETTYYLFGGRGGDEQAASAHALLLDHAISEAQGRGHKFDFEGSMHPGIANFFQSFGATPENFWQIRKFKGLGKLWSLFH